MALADYYRIDGRSRPQVPLNLGPTHAASAATTSPGCARMHDSFLVVGGRCRAADEPVPLGRVPGGGLTHPGSGGGFETGE